MRDDLSRSWVTWYFLAYLAKILVRFYCWDIVFDIMYPKQLAAIFLFFQQSMVGLKDARKPPPCLVKLSQKRCIENTPIIVTFHNLNLD